MQYDTANICDILFETTYQIPTQHPQLLQDFANDLISELPEPKVTTAQLRDLFQIPLDSPELKQYLNQVLTQIQHLGN